jgi:hypothetical protein
MRGPLAGVIGCAGALALSSLAPADDPPKAPTALTAEELERRAKAFKEERAAWEQSQADAAAKRAEALAAESITGVEPLGPVHDPARAVDIVVIGDGFTSEEMAEWRKVAATVVSNYATRPFDTHAAHVNFYRVDLVSKESGLDSIDGATVDTPLEGAVRPAGAGKLLACNVTTTARLARLCVPEADYILCVLNTHGKFLGSANTGKIVRLSTSKGHQRSIVMHEFGHNFGPFLDEYVDGKQGGSRKPSPRLEGSVNATLESNVRLARWHHWNIPEAVFTGTAKKKQRGKHFAFEDTVKCFEGAATYFDGAYRAEENCHMQRGRGKQFCRVCTEGLEVRLMRFFPPVERVAPLGHVQRIGLNETLTLSVQPTAHALGGETVRVCWYQDGKRLEDRKVKVVKPKRGEPGGDRWELTLKGALLKAGEHRITATVDLDSPRSHLDRGTQSSAYSWLVEVTERGPLLKAPKQVAGTAGQPVAVHVERHPAGAPGAWTCVNPPAGAEITADGDKLAVQWTPAQAGRYRVVFEQWRDDFVARRAVPVQVKAAAAGRNKPPRFLFVPPHQARVGAALTLPIPAWDPDGDHCGYSAERLPHGAAVHPDTGTLTWTPGHTQAGRHTFTVTVTDGGGKASQDVVVDVAGAALFRGIFRQNVEALPPFTSLADRVLVAAHHTQVTVRWKAIESLAAAPPDCAFAHALRYLRFQQPKIADWAKAHITARLAAAPAAHLPMLLEQLPRTVWQHVDEPAKLAYWRATLTTLLGTDGLDRKPKQELEALVKDLDLIDWYNTTRREQPGPEAIRDKKFK